MDVWWLLMVFSWGKRRSRGRSELIFRAISRPEATGKLTLVKFKASLNSLGWKEFKDSEAVEIFRYLDPDGGGREALKRLISGSFAWISSDFHRSSRRFRSETERNRPMFDAFGPSEPGSISLEEWQVMAQLLQELQLCILELLQ